jgi:hypothetical protein
MFCPYYPPRFNHPNSVWLSVQIIKFVITLSSQASCYSCEYGMHTNISDHGQRFRKYFVPRDGVHNCSTCSYLLHFTSISMHTLNFLRPSPRWRSFCGYIACNCRNSSIFLQDNCVQSDCFPIALSRIFRSAQPPPPHIWSWAPHKWLHPV